MSVPDETGRDRVADLLNAYADDDVTTLETMKRVERLCAHLDAQATRIATLEREVERLRGISHRLLDEWRADRFEWRENREEVLSLRVKQPHTGGSLFDELARALDAHPAQTEDET